MKMFYILGLGSDGMGRGDGVYTLLADHGEFLASHYCSHAGYADGDLWRDRPERKKEWDERFGEWKVIWLGGDEMKLSVLIERNKEWAKKDKEAQEKIEKIEKNGTSIKVTMSD